jgi:hypothetical protein
MRKGVVVTALGVGLLAAGAFRLSPSDAGTDAKPAALTPMDYVEIRQLVARYPWAMDSGTDNGYAFADLFTGDGESVRPNAKGRDRLAALAQGGRRGPMYVSRYAMNLVIERSPQGAVGRQYTIDIDIDDNGPRPGQAQSPPVQGGGEGRGQSASQWDLVGRKGGKLSSIGGHYQDEYVRTSSG